MIPKKILREHILKAIEEVAIDGIPEDRSSRKFLLEYEVKHYPPKYIISIANKYANGKVLEPSEFNGGQESNGFLRKLGFTIVKKSSSCAAVSSKSSRIQNKKKNHTERCPKCKDTVLKMLRKIYGKVDKNYKFNEGLHPEDFRKSPFYTEMQGIYKSLQDYRGHKIFVKAKTLPPCDFYIHKPGFILEFDESQHFTRPRQITLEQYPQNLSSGFNIEKWVDFSRKINSKDNDPIYRDEQRAWYDTVRDFLPSINGLGPTIRIFAGDFRWCSLNPDEARDIEQFKALLGSATTFSKSTDIGRVIIADRKWEGNTKEARKLLENLCDTWPKKKKVKVLMTCGGFILFDWPKRLPDIKDNIHPETRIVDALIREAEVCLKKVLTDDLTAKLKSICDYITLGIDSYRKRDSTKDLHVELVSVYDLRNKKFYWTGKSYPTSAQQDGLVRFPKKKLKSHFITLEGIGKVMILGCHDLTIFNPRSKTAKGWRKKVNSEFKSIASAEKPLLVLHHPHSTVKYRTWLNAWNCLKKILPSVKQYVGAGIYGNDPKERKKTKWNDLNKVLNSNRGSQTTDAVYRRGIFDFL